MTEAADQATQPAPESTTADDRNRIERGSDINRNAASTVLDSSVVAPEATQPTIPEKFLGENGEPNVEMMAKSYAELENKLRTTRPSAPEDADAYDFDWGDFPIDEEKTSAFKQKAHEMGLSTEQYNGLMEMYRDEITGAMPTAESAEKVLKEQWGNNFDTNLQNANKAWSVFGDGLEIDPVIGNHPAVLEIMARIGAELSEDVADVDATSAPSPYLSDTEIADLRKRPDYWTNKEIQKKVQAAYAAKRGEQ